MTVIMNGGSSTLFKILVLAIIAISTGNARQEKQPKVPVKKHPLTSMPSRAAYIGVSYHLPHNGNKNLPIGGPITILCHLTNDGKLPINVTGIMGSLNHHKHFGEYIQNFTYQPLSVVVKPAEEITLAYNFTMNKDLEPEKFRIAHTVFYEREQRPFSSTFFNEVRQSNEFLNLNILMTLVCINYTTH